MALLVYLLINFRKGNTMNYKEKIEEWKEEAGEIPENTCPNIDKLVKGLTDLEDIINRAERRYDDVKTLADDLSWTMPDYSVLEDLRRDNDKLRSLGAFWYEKCKELTTLIEQVQKEAVGGFARWCDIDQEAIYNHPHFMQDYADQYLNQIKEDLNPKEGE